MPRTKAHTPRKPQKSARAPRAPARPLKASPAQIKREVDAYLRQKKPFVYDPLEFNPPHVSARQQAIYDAEDRERLQRLIKQLAARDKAWLTADPMLLDGYLPVDWQTMPDVELLKYIADNEITPEHCHFA